VLVDVTGFLSQNFDAILFADSIFLFLRLPQPPGLARSAKPQPGEWQTELFAKYDDCSEEMKQCLVNKWNLLSSNINA